MTYLRSAFIFAAPLLLVSCLLSPGKFVSTLDIKADRSFTFTYVGEVILTDPEETMGETVDSLPAVENIMDAAENVAEAIEAASPAPAVPVEETPAKFAERKAIGEALAKEVGYRSVEYLGNKKYRVDYAISGRLDRSFLYPINIDAQAIIPWIAVEVRKDGSARMMALAFGDSDQGAAGLGAAGGGEDKPNAQREGIFTLTTDAALIMQNNEDGLAPGPGTRVVWRVSPSSRTVPTAVVRFAN